MRPALPAVLKRLFAPVLICLPLCACQEAAPPAGIVASVNGEPIALHSLQSLIDSRSASLGIPPRPSLDEMRKNYGHALGILIAHALVRQELAKRGMEISSKKVDEDIEKIRKDYGEDNLDQFLAEASIRQEDWRRLMLDHLALETFKEQVMRPGIRIELAEIREYYKTHEEDFSLPDSLRVCMLAGESKGIVESWCAAMDQEKIPDGMTSQCLDVSAGDIPPDWSKELKGMKAGSCAQPRNEGGQWLSIALVDRKKARKPGIAEVYALIENILLEQKQNSAFEQWLARSLDQSTILVAPDLKNCLTLKEAAGAAEKRKDAAK